ncbi:unnamed protein product [Nippostrongylus brasiliensis]|uniref:Peptidase A2 domain-containing protein n=1 Tax=Nippostrongylus brasiliensis TaxID=27835 RepID=A0A0N4YAG4_NIPBR|nr:unnamed protein product [Nippostrongylus brasiliensis]
MDVDDDIEAVMCMKITDTNTHSKDCVLIGEALVFNPSTHALEVVHILLDTGVDCSFISEDLAERLQLKNVDTLRMSINTFGDQQPKEKEGGVTTLQIFVRYGKPHWFKVARIEYLTEQTYQQGQTEKTIFSCLSASGWPTYAYKFC